MIIFQPAKTWSELADEKEEEIVDNDSFFKTYLYPVIGIVALLTFAGVFFHKKEFSVELALRLTINALISLFVGFYLASHLLSEMMLKFFSDKKQYKLCQRFIAYSSALIYVMYMVLALFSGYNFLLLILLYTVYIVWEGAVSYMQIPEEQRINFTMFASAIVLLSPFIIKWIMFMTMPGMKV